MGRGRVAARPLAGDALFFTLVGIILGTGGGDLPGGRQVRRRRPASGGRRPTQHDPGRATEPARERTDAEGTTVTPSATALGSVLAAEAGLQAPGLEEFYPEPLVSLLAARHRLRDHPHHADPVDRDAGDDRAPGRRRAQAADRARASCSSSARAATRWSATASPATSSAPRACRSRRSSASLFFFILANNAMTIMPFVQISPMSKFAFPLVLALICWVLYIWVGIREQGVGQVLQGHPVPARRPRGACTSS